MVYGIRHHGPGSARALLEALEAQLPDALAVELPADLAPALTTLGDPALTPPVALVAYDPKAVQQALYYPLARFSPEWVAMRWACERGIPIHAIDLPAKLMIGLARARANTLALDAKPKSLHRLRVDPLGELAALAGYTDRERWWEQTFELQSGGANVFPAVLDMIAALREAYPEATDEECRLREMHMARQLLALEKAGAENLAVVCGAWHAPVLAEAERKTTAKGYAAAKRGLKGPKLETAWIPYTYERLRTGAGYGAGVRSPVWYALLFDGAQQAPARYLTLMARELRERGHGASTAQVLDAVALTQQLASLRDLSLPGLEEIREAALGVLADGSTERLDIALSAVESLRTTGRVPASFTRLPLQRDLEARLKAVRLLKPYRDMEKVAKVLDLRKPPHLAASQLLCQLLLLGIPFGDRQDAARGAQGTFREDWTLHWKPDFALRLLACHTYGQTAAVAAASALRERLTQDATLPSLTSAIDLVILAGLFDQLSDVAARIQHQAADTSDVWVLAAALPAILRATRYTSLRIQESAYLLELTEQLLPKLAVGLPGACANVDADAAYDAFRILKLVQPYLSMLDEEGLVRLWYRALERTAYGKQTHPLLAGFALRTLTDAQRSLPEQTAKAFGANLGSGLALESSGHFVEGFLYSSSLVLLHQAQVLELLDAWLLRISVDEFRSLLPALRRTFAAFPGNERRKLNARLQENGRHESTSTAAVTTLAPGLEAALQGWLAPPPSAPPPPPQALEQDR